jgi:glycosyl transferase, family 25
MHIYIISLEREQQRRAHIVEQFSNQNISFEFFNAITPATIEHIKGELGLGHCTTTLHQKEVACLLSHALMWKKAIEDRLDYIAIFEDDIHLGQNARYFLQDTDWIPDVCEIIKLEKFYKKIGISLGNKQYFLTDHRKLLALVTVHMGGGGYILSQKAARQLLEMLKNNKQLIPVDHLIFREYLKLHRQCIYQMSPALCVQDMILKKGKTIFPSALEEVRNERKGENFSKKKLSFMMKIKRELSRMGTQVYKAVQESLQLLKGIKIQRISFK